MNALVKFFSSVLELMNNPEVKDEYNMRLAYYNQAFGAVVYEAYRAIEKGDLRLQCEAERLWEEEWKAKFDKALWGE